MAGLGDYIGSLHFGFGWSIWADVMLGVVEVKVDGVQSPLAMSIIITVTSHENLEFVDSHLIFPSYLQV